MVHHKYLHGLSIALDSPKQLQSQCKARRVGAAATATWTFLQDSTIAGEGGVCVCTALNCTWRKETKEARRGGSYCTQQPPRPLCGSGPVVLPLLGAAHTRWNHWNPLQPLWPTQTTDSQTIPRPTRAIVTHWNYRHIETLRQVQKTLIQKNIKITLLLKSRRIYKLCKSKIPPPPPFPPPKKENYVLTNGRKCNPRRTK